MTNNSRLPSSSVVGYLRVSTADQDLEKNKADILQLANNHDLGRVHFVEEKISGKVCWRNRKLAEVLGSLRANDAIIVNELSRLGAVCSNVWRSSRLQRRSGSTFIRSK